MKHKNLKTLKATTVVEKGSMTAIASTEDVDRSGDVLLVKDWDFGNFLKNPVLQAGHDYRPQYTIGVAKDLRVEGNQVLFTPVFHEITPLASQIKQMYEQGILKAWSVGYIPSDYTANKKHQLLEVSAVSVPDNQNALTLIKSLEGEAKGYEDGTVKSVDDWVHKELTASGAEEGTETKEEDVETEKLTLTQEDLEANPELAEEGLKEGDEVEIPVPASEEPEAKEPKYEEAVADTVEDAKTKKIEALKQKWLGAFSSEADNVDWAFYSLCDDVFNVMMMHKTALQLDVIKREQSQNIDTSGEEPIPTTDIATLVSTHYGQMSSDVALVIGLHQQYLQSWLEKMEATEYNALGLDEAGITTKSMEALRQKYAVEEKEGRVLSQANRKVVESAVDATKQAVVALENLLEATDKSQEEKSVVEEATPQELKDDVEAKGREPSVASKSQPQKGKQLSADEILLRAMQKIAKNSNFVLRELKSNKKESK